MGGLRLWSIPRTNNRPYTEQAENDGFQDGRPVRKRTPKARMASPAPGGVAPEMRVLRHRFRPGSVRLPLLLLGLRPTSLPAQEGLGRECLSATSASLAGLRALQVPESRP